MADIPSSWADDLAQPESGGDVADGYLVDRPGVGRRGFIAGTAAAAAGTALVAAAESSVHAASGLNKYVPLKPARLCDTRASVDFGYTSRSGNVTRVKIAGRTVDGVVVPANATAAVFTLVGISSSPAGNYLAAYPSGTQWSGTSSLNMVNQGEAIANLVTVKLGGGSVDILSENPSNIIVDLAGVYVASAATEREGRYQAVAPVRVLDTRAGPRPGKDSVVRVDLSGQVAIGAIDADATAVSINLTAARVAHDGYLTVYPFGETVPKTSSINILRNQNRAIGALATVGRDSQGRPGFNVLVKYGSHVIVDIEGFITGPSANRSSGGLFVPLDPIRLMDTRRGHGGQKRLWPGWTREFDLPSEVRNQAGTAVLNMTVARPMGDGFFSVNAAQTREGAPETSNVNVSGGGGAVANHVVSRASLQGVEVYSSSGGDVIADLVGYYKSAPVNAIFGVPSNPRPTAPPPYWTRIPSIAVMNSGRSTIAGSSSNSVVDSGRLWHWSGTGYVGQNNYIAIFGHRTDAGGPFRYVDQLGAGDRIYLSTGDQRTYVYKYNRRELTAQADSQILAATQRVGGETVSLIACTVGYDRSKSAYPNQWAPTSLKYRIVVTFTLEYWTDDIPI